MLASLERRRCAQGYDQTESTFLAGAAYAANAPRNAACSPRRRRQVKRASFGTRLIERSLAQEFSGEGSLAYVPAGMVYTIKAPL